MDAAAEEESAAAVLEAPSARSSSTSRPDDIDVDVILPDDLDVIVQRARDDRDRASEASASARVTFRDAIAAAAAEGMPRRDIGRLLDVSHQRIAKVAAELE